MDAGNPQFGMSGQIWEHVEPAMRKKELQLVFFFQSEESLEIIYCLGLFQNHIFRPEYLHYFIYIFKKYSI